METRLPLASVTASTVGTFHSIIDLGTAFDTRLFDVSPRHLATAEDFVGQPQLRYAAG